MTPVPQAIFAALSPVFNAQVYPQIAPDGTLPPFAVYGRVGSAPSNTLNDGIPMECDRYQIDVYSTTYLECTQLAKSARNAMLALPQPLSVYLTLELEQFEADVKFHRTISDFLISQPRS